MIDRRSRRVRTPGGKRAARPLETRWAGRSGPAHPESSPPLPCARLVRTWLYQVGAQCAASGFPSREGHAHRSRGRTPVHVTRLATVASHHAQRREALPASIRPARSRSRQSPARPSRTAPSRSVSRSTRARTCGVDPAGALGLASTGTARPRRGGRPGATAAADRTPAPGPARVSIRPFRYSASCWMYSGVPRPRTDNR